MKCVDCLHFRENLIQLKNKNLRKLYILFTCIDCGDIIQLKNSTDAWVSRGPNGKWRCKIKL
jgi:hypothetical protein